MSKTKSKTLPKRSQVKPQDCWNLSSLFKTDAAWETAFKKFESMVPGFDKFRGALGKSAAQLAACLKFDNDVSRLQERIGVYAFLKTSEDQANSDYQRMKGRYQHVATKAAEAGSFIRPELMAIAPETMEKFLESAALDEWKLALERILRYRPHTLSQNEEQLLA